MFSIFNEHGMIEWFEKTDLSDVDLASSVRINPRSIEIYENCEGSDLPPRGTKLNTPALVTLYRVPPTGKKTAEEYGLFLREKIEGAGATHIAYDVHTYKWVFRVNGA